MASAGANDTLTRAIGPIVGHLGRYWLDSGTLLGLARDGKLIGWDNDIDLAIWEDDVAHVTAAIPKLKAQGIEAHPRRFGGRIYSFTIDQPGQQVPPVHLHVYFRHADVAWSPQTVAYAKVDRPNAEAGFTGARTRRLLWPIKREAVAFRNGTLLQRLYRTALCLPVWGAIVMVRNRLDRQHWSSVWPLSSLYATYTWMVPARLFDSLTTIEHGGLSLPIPADTEAYLSARYGNWRQPQSDWCYWTDDGCIVPEPPEQALGRQR